MRGGVIGLLIFYYLRNEIHAVSVNSRFDRSAVLCVIYSVIGVEPYPPLNGIPLSINERRRTPPDGLSRFIYHSNPLFGIMSTALVVLRPVTPPVRCGDSERTTITSGWKTDLSLTLFHKRLCNRSRLMRKSGQVSYPPPILHPAPSQFTCRIVPVKHSPNRTLDITKFCRLRYMERNFTSFHLST